VSARVVASLWEDREVSLVYDSFAEVPLDIYDKPDHDDRDVPGAHGLGFTPPPDRRMQLAGASVVPRTMVVPFNLLKLGSSGSAVIALKRALSRAGFMEWGPFTRLLGPFAVNALKRFQSASHVPVTGVYDRATHEKLARHYDAYSLRYLLSSQTPTTSKEQRARQAFQASLMYLYNRRSAIAYTQARPGDCRKPPAGADCSFSGEWAGSDSGVGSLSGYSGCGYGNTDTQIARFRRLGQIRTAAVATWELCDPVYYGQGLDPSHVAFWLGGGRVWSFGSYPIKIHGSVDYRSDRIAVAALIV
jgi:peptidoglycan hydrolase-like protein with peptidoglycan-binding domain